MEDARWTPPFSVCTSKLSSKEETSWYKDVFHNAEADQQTEPDFFTDVLLHKLNVYMVFFKVSPLVECTSYSVAVIPRTHDAGHSLLGPW